MIIMSKPSQKDKIVRKAPDRSRIRTATERAKLDAQVADLRLRGLIFDEIAETLGIAKGTAHAAYKRFQVEFKKNHMDDQSVLLAEYHGRMEKAWKLHYAKWQSSIPLDTNGKAIKGQVGDVKHIKDGIDIQNQMFDRLQSAGLLPKRTEKLSFQGHQDIKFTIVDKFSKKRQKEKNIKKKKA